MEIFYVYIIILDDVRVLDESNGVDNETNMTPVNTRNPMMAPGWERSNDSPMPGVNERKRSGDLYLKRKKRYDPIMRFPLKSKKPRMTLDYLEQIIALGCPSNDEITSGAETSSFCKRAELFLATLREHNDLIY